MAAPHQDFSAVDTVAKESGKPIVLIAAVGAGVLAALCAGIAVAAIKLADSGKKNSSPKTSARPKSSTPRRQEEPATEESQEHKEANLINNSTEPSGTVASTEQVPAIEGSPKQGTESSGPVASPELFREAFEEPSEAPVPASQKSENKEIKAEERREWLETVVERRIISEFLNQNITQEDFHTDEDSEENSVVVKDFFQKFGQPTLTKGKWQVLVPLFKNFKLSVKQWEAMGRVQAKDGKEFGASCDICRWEDAEEDGHKHQDPEFGPMAFKDLKTAFEQQSRQEHQPQLTDFEFQQYWYSLKPV